MKLTKKQIIIIGLVSITIIALLVFSGKKHEGNITTTVQRGAFNGIVYTSGQLQAKQSITINAPSQMSAPQIQLNDIKITSLIEEGTAVDSGDFVASLDHAAVIELQKTALEDLDKTLGELQDAKADTSINLSNLRDELLNAKVTLEEKNLVAEQSIYESPSVQRQANIDVERSQRDLEQKYRNYDLKVQQEKHKIFKANDKYRRQQEKLNNINELLDALEIHAPSSGIIIHSYDRMGSKIKVGSKVSRYSPQIAELPDLRTLTSKTFVNEVDISKVSIGQSVKVGVDAFPDKSFSGIVKSVANIGQVIPGGDAKVFEVSIQVNGSDPQLKPGMTTSNIITTHAQEDQLYIPLESLFVEAELTFVFIADGNSIVKKEIVGGSENENYIIITDGLKEGDIVLLNKPYNSETIVLERLKN